MSHFTVMVVTENEPDNAQLSQILQPWHEYECTGTEDEYVVDVDKTEEALAAYTEATVTRLRDSAGVLHSQFDEQGAWKPEFSREEADDIFPKIKRRVAYVPEGYELVEIPASTVETAAEWIHAYYGWPILGTDSLNREAKFGRIVVDAEGEVVKCYDRTNPNAKWDWWVVGGRWRGLLKLKPEHARAAELGRMGTMEALYGEQEYEPEQTSVAMKGHVDFQTQWEQGWQEGLELWDKVYAAAGDLPAPEAWEVYLERVKQAKGDGPWPEKWRDGYWNQPAVKAIKQAFPDAWEIEDQLQALTVTREEMGQLYKNRAVATYAYVRDGKWLQRGEMGWWGLAANEQSADQWYAHMAQMLEELPDTHWLTIIDCHI